LTVLDAVVVVELLALVVLEPPHPARRSSEAIASSAALRTMSHPFV
jgi:hypothetical protein